MLKLYILKTRSPSIGSTDCQWVCLYGLSYEPFKKNARIVTFEVVAVAEIAHQQQVAAPNSRVGK
ncbi:MAG: hypothetical protein PUP90_09965 [Nostoc sp. S4]|nr:hypothetical protein [Nostoc sp. S4]